MKKNYLHFIKKVDLRILPILFLPFFLISGPLLSEVSIILLDFFLIKIIWKNDGKFREELFKNSIFIFLIVFYVYLVISNIFLLNLKNFINYFFYIRIILFSFTIFYFLKSKIIIEKNLLKVFEITILVFVIDLIIQFYFGFNILGIEQQHETRISGFFVDELIAGSFLIKIFPIYFYLHIVNKKRINLLFFSFLTLFIIGVLLSNERTSFYLMILMFLLWSPILLSRIKILNIKNFFSFIFLILILIATIVFLIMIRGIKIEYFIKHIIIYLEITIL